MSYQIEDGVCQANINLPQIEPVFSGSEALIQALGSVGQEIASRAHEIEQAGSLPNDLYDKLSATGLFKIMIPKKFGGAEYSLTQVIPVLEEIARADGSTAWSVMVGTEIHIGWTRFSAKILESVYKNPAMTRGALTPKGKISKVEGGYILDGQWPLASGSYPTDWFLIGGIVSDDAGRPVTNSNGVVDLMLSAVPAGDVSVLPTWNSMGMRSTDSNDISLKNYFVPEERTAFQGNINSDAGPISRIPLYSALSTFHTGVVLGIARGMLDDLALSVKTKRPMLAPKTFQSQSPLFQQRYARLEIKLAATKAFAESETARLWDIAVERGAVSSQDSARYRSAVAHVHHECMTIVNDAFSDAGTASLYHGSSMQRRFRDMRTACQHICANLDLLAIYGALLLGEGVEFNG